MKQILFLQEPQCTSAVLVCRVLYGTKQGPAAALQHEPGWGVWEHARGRAALWPVTPVRVTTRPAAPAFSQPQHWAPPHCHRLAGSPASHSGSGVALWHQLGAAPFVFHSWLGLDLPVLVCQPESSHNMRSLVVREAGNCHTKPQVFLSCNITIITFNGGLASSLMIKYKKK